MTPYELPSAPECPGCGCEAEVVRYWREIGSKRRVGYTCTCGARVIRNIVVTLGDI